MPDWWQSVAGLALQAHALLAPGVPLIGWDVALPAEPEGAALLEMNISCNCFNGTYDRRGARGRRGPRWAGVMGQGGAAGRAAKRPHAPPCAMPTRLRPIAPAHLHPCPRRREGYYDLQHAFFAELWHAERERTPTKRWRRGCGGRR